MLTHESPVRAGEYCSNSEEAFQSTPPRICETTY
jgi:hypothetical protein